LVKILTYHVVPGRLDTEVRDQDIKKGNGKVTLKTVEGDTLTVTGRGNASPSPTKRGTRQK
jgi:uncharacterized surface protein with fasciclin (FAS1) repeats